MFVYYHDLNEDQATFDDEFQAEIERKSSLIFLAALSLKSPNERPASASLPSEDRQMPRHVNVCARCQADLCFLILNFTNMMGDSFFSLSRLRRRELAARSAFVLIKLKHLSSAGLRLGTFLGGGGKERAGALPYKPPPASPPLG